MMKWLVGGFVGVTLATAGCQSTYYKAWEKLGWAKRDILVDRVKDAREDEEAAKKQFQSALEQFQAVTHFEGGDLEAKYKKLNSEYESCVSRSDAVHKRVAAVDSVAQDMFKEWKSELSEYQDAKLKSASEQKLGDAQSRYAQLIAAMRKSEEKMDPVLKAFHDQVLFLKHNLNAQAVASLQTTAAGIDQDVQALIKDMEASINEANAFIAQMKS